MFCRPALGIWALSSLVVVRHLCLAFFLAVAVTLLPLLTLIVYRLSCHPLAWIPGPKLAAISNIWLAHHVRDGRSCELGKTLHKKYGPVVRVGPNEVWFNSGEAFREIYRTLAHGSNGPAVLTAFHRLRKCLWKVGLLLYVT